MIVIVTGLFSLSPLTIVLMIVTWESSQWLRKNIMWSTGERNHSEEWTGRDVTE